MGREYFKRGIVTVGAGNQHYTSDVMVSSGGFAYDAATTNTTGTTIPNFGVQLIRGDDSTAIYTLAAPPTDRVREMFLMCVIATSSNTANVYVTTGTTDAHFQSSAAATTTERMLHFDRSNAFARLMATSSHVWSVIGASTHVTQNSTG